MTTQFTLKGLSTDVPLPSSESIMVGDYVFNLPKVRDFSNSGIVKLLKDEGFVVSLLHPSGYKRHSYFDYNGLPSDIYFHREVGADNEKSLRLVSAGSEYLKDIRSLIDFHIREATGA